MVWNGRSVGRSSTKRVLVVAMLLGPGPLLVSCSFEDDCSDEVEVAQRFLNEPSHLTCQSNEDCVIVSTGCHSLARGMCGQVQLNAKSAASKAWRDREALLQQCNELGDCAFCGAALSATCSNGLCGGPL